MPNCLRGFGKKAYLSSSEVVWEGVILLARPKSRAKRAFASQLERCFGLLTDVHFRANLFISKIETKRRLTMPKKIVRVTYACGICSSEHEKREDAIECENRGLAMPEFKRHEVVELINFPPASTVVVSSGYRFALGSGIEGVVHTDGLEEGSPNPHLLPARYDVWLKTPGGPYKKELATFDREDLKRAAVKNSDPCPLCGSAECRKKLTSGSLLSLEDRFPFLRRIPVRVCSNCDVEFFTTEQSRYAKAIALERKSWLLADTRRLIRKREFQ